MNTCTLDKDGSYRVSGQRLSNRGCSSCWPDDDDVEDLFGEFAIDLDFKSSPGTLPASEHQKRKGGDHGVINAGEMVLFFDWLSMHASCPCA